MGLKRIRYGRVSLGIYLSKLFAMSIPSPEAIAIKDEVAFLQAVKARINKFSRGFMVDQIAHM